MTVSEILDCLSAFNYKQQHDYDRQCMLIWQLGQLCAIGFNNPKEYPQFDTFLAAMKGEKTKLRQQDWRIMKQNMIDYSNAVRTSRR